MSLTMYEISVPKLKHIMLTLNAILEKAIAFSEDKKIALDCLPTCRLIADMHPLSKQVQIVSDQAKGCVSRLAGQTAPVFEDNEQTLPELIERLNKTIAFLDTFNAEKINGTEDKEITIEVPNLTLKFTGQKYVQDFVMPNVYFHFTTAYDILRANGVVLSKRDFIGNIF